MEKGRVNYGGYSYREHPTEPEEASQWVTWRCVQRNGRLTKVPYQVDGNTPAKTNDPQTWGSFAEAVVTQLTNLVDGVGLVFTPGAGLVGIDLDDALDETGTLLQKAQHIVKRIGSYTEISPSGRGLHILCRAALVKGIRRGPAEIYPNGRYFTMTRKCLPGFEYAEPKESQRALDWLVGKMTKKREPSRAATGGYLKDYPHGESDEKLIEKALSAKNGEKFRRLFVEGDWGGYPRPDYLDRSLAYLRGKGAA